MSVTPPFPTPPFTPRTRPSAHQVSRLCGEAKIVGLLQRETATVLSIVHLTNWSAELIANRVHDFLDVSVSPETLWDTYKTWNDARFKNQPDGPIRLEDRETIEAMVRILRHLGIEPTFNARPLCHTPRPVTVPFTHVWYPVSPSKPVFGIQTRRTFVSQVLPRDDLSLSDANTQQLDTGIFADFTEDNRNSCIKALTWRRENRDLSKTVTLEDVVLDRLGSHVTRIAKNLLRKWIEDMAKVIAKLPFTKAIELGQENWNLIDQYVDAFKSEWEAEFGQMDDEEAFCIPIATDPRSIHIRSTGAAAKLFFCLMMLTRLQALEERRKCWRAMQCFIEVPLEELPADVKSCHICQEPFGEPNEDGDMEMPIRVVACCGNYFGADCLQRWYGEYGNSRCPLCKWTASQEFLDKLSFEDHESES